jgi:heat shock protein HslJ
VRLAVAPLALAVVGALVTGCGGDDGGGADASSLEGVPWVLTAGIEVEGWEDAAPSASFDEGRVSGSTGCNRYSGPYTVEGDTLELGTIAATRMACPPPASDVETAFLASLETVAAWGMDDEELILLDADDEERLRFGVATPVGSWLATGFLNGDAFTSLLMGTEITATFSEENEVSGSSGCNTYTATSEADAGAIEISAPTTTKRLCTEPTDVMEQEAAYLGALASAVRYRIDGGTLELSRADGTRVVSFARS